MGEEEEEAVDEEEEAVDEEEEEEEVEEEEDEEEQEEDIIRWCLFSTSVLVLNTPPTWARSPADCNSQRTVRGRSFSPTGCAAPAPRCSGASWICRKPSLEAVRHISGSGAETRSGHQRVNSGATCTALPRP